MPALFAPSDLSRRLPSRRNVVFGHACRELPRGTLALPLSRGTSLAKPNYSFEKRQREIAKKKQQEEKDARKREAREAAKAAQKPSGGT
jgi:hypothetical protein